MERDVYGTCEYVEIEFMTSTIIRTPLFYSVNKREAEVEFKIESQRKRFERAKLLI